MAFIGVFPVKVQHLLKFNTNGKFKAALENIEEVLEAENSDFVMFTGNVVYGKPADKGICEVFGLVSERKIPFAVTYGNRDDT